MITTFMVIRIIVADTMKHFTTNITELTMEHTTLIIHQAGSHQFQVEDHPLVNRIELQGTMWWVPFCNKKKHIQNNS